MQSFGISLNNISQLEAFVEHAQYHSIQYGDNVLVFISKHYGELKTEHDKEHQEEKKDHEQLPFNHNNNSHLLSITAFVLITVKEELKFPEFLEFKTNNFFYQVHSSSLHSQGILQPPQYS